MISNKSFDNKDWDPFRSLEGMVRLTLIAVWDPVGVFGHPGDLDEYDDYVLPVVGLLKDGISAEDLVLQLQKFHVEWMSIAACERMSRADQLTAETLVNLFSNFDS